MDTSLTLCISQEFIQPLEIIVSPIVMYCVGWGMYKLVINKVVDKDLFTSILATFGISILAQQLMNFAFGADVVVAQSDFGTTMLFNDISYNS